MESIEFLKLIDSLRELKNEITSLGDIIESAAKRSDYSENIDELMTALAKAQGEMHIATKDSNNPFFKSKYADLAEVVKASRPFLAKNGLCVMQNLTLDNDGKRIIVTILGHSSGQFITSRMAIIPIKDDIQSLGSAITYMRRYTYASLVGVVADDEDDDGETAMKPVRSQVTNNASKFGNISQQYDVISKDEHGMLDDLLGEVSDVLPSLLNKYNIEHLEDLPKIKFREVNERLLKIKRDREGLPR